MMTRGKPHGPEAIAVAEAAEARGDYVQAAAAYTEVSEDAEAGTAAEGHFRLGRVNWRQARHAEAMAAFERARELARQAQRADLESRAETGIGAVHYALGELSQARASFQVAMQRTQDPVQVGRCVLNLGAIASAEGDGDLALSCYLRARTLFRDQADGAGEALALRNLGLLYAHREEWEAAEDAYAQCLAQCERQGDRAMISRVLLDQAEVFVMRQAHGRAIRNCEIAQTIAVELGDEVGRGEALRWQGHALRMAGDASAAERVLLEAVRVGERFRVKRLEAEARRELEELTRQADAAG